MGTHSNLHCSLLIYVTLARIIAHEVSHITTLKQLWCRKVQTQMKMHICKSPAFKVFLWSNYKYSYYKLNVLKVLKVEVLIVQ